MTLPKIAFDVNYEQANLEGEWYKVERVKVIDRHGQDITDLLRIVEIGMTTMATHRCLEARLVFRKRDWRVESENEMSENTTIFRSGYDLSDGLEPNTIDEHFPRERERVIAITFDAAWGTL